MLAQPGEGGEGRGAYKLLADALAAVIGPERREEVDVLDEEAGRPSRTRS